MLSSKNGFAQLSQTGGESTNVPNNRAMETGNIIDTGQSNVVLVNASRSALLVLIDEFISLENSRLFS